jgi:hypothetical protein
VIEDALNLDDGCPFSMATGLSPNGLLASADQIIDPAPAFTHGCTRRLPAVALGEGGLPDERATVGKPIDIQHVRTASPSHLHYLLCLGLRFEHDFACHPATYRLAHRLAVFVALHLLLVVANHLLHHRIDLVLVRFDGRQVLGLCHE